MVLCLPYSSVLPSLSALQISVQFSVLLSFLCCPRALSEVHSTKKSSLKSLVECFPQRVGGVAGPSPTPPPPSAAMMLVPPMAVGPSLTHEQVMPFLRKMERGQPTEGWLCKRCCLIPGLLPHIEEGFHSGSLGMGQQERAVYPFP